jgi:hypothetical protein
MESHRSSRLSGFAFGGLEADAGSAGALAEVEFFQPVGLFVDFAILVPALAGDEWHGQVKENRDALATISARELDACAVKL